MTLTASVGIIGGSDWRWRPKAPQARGQATRLREKCRLQGLSAQRVPERRGPGDAFFYCAIDMEMGEMGCLVGGWEMGTGVDAQKICFPWW